ncbi:MAG TPA: YihY family inner membrane protein [Dongiaceae bacterium]|jgi:membrane protein
MNDQPEQREGAAPPQTEPAPEAETGFVAQARDLGLGLLHLLEHASKRLLADRCMQVAAALSFTTILSLVPFLAISLSFISAFSQFGDLRNQVETLLTQNLLPQAGETAVEQFRSFVAQTQRLTGLGIFGVAVTAIMLLATINHAFDVIWRVQRPRPLLIRFLAYWAILTLGPLLIGAALSVSGLLFAAGERVAGVAFKESVAWVAPLMPLVLQAVAFTLLYLIAPNRHVKFSDALIGGAVAAVAFEIVKRAFALYLVFFPSYEAIYGAVAAIPIFLLWIYCCWVTVLLGAEVTASLPEARETRRR